jgi:hypothetical protein
VLKVAALVFGLIIVVMVAAPYFHFNPVIPIFVILGFGIYMVGRIGGPQLPADTQVGFGNTYGVYLHREDFVPPDPDSHSGGHLRDGVDPNDPKAR